jgi:hypothetical protein
MPTTDCDVVVGSLTIFTLRNDQLGGGKNHRGLLMNTYPGSVTSSFLVQAIQASVGCAAQILQISWNYPGIAYSDIGHMQS